MLTKLREGRSVSFMTDRRKHWHEISELVRPMNIRGFSNLWRYDGDSNLAPASVKGLLTLAIVSVAIVTLLSNMENPAVTTYSH